MAQTRDREAFEERLRDEILVDAYGPEEQAASWWCYLDTNLRFPFRARCKSERGISPLRVGEEVEVLRMAGEEECLHEMFGVIRWQDREFGVPLSQLEGLNVDAATRQALDDWHHWSEEGYEL